MADQSVVVTGLPGSGKTTYLAALWHIVTARDLPTKLKFTRLGEGSKRHLNEIAARWRDAKQQERTLLQGLKTVRMNLSDAAGNDLTVTFPDVPGEEYRKMWEEREIDPLVMENLRAKSVLLFVHSDEINAPNWIADEVELYKQWNVALPEGQLVPWHPRAAPTQVQLVEILQLLRSAPLDVGPRKLAIMLSVWDKAKGEGLSPDEFLMRTMPLLGQYLSCNVDDWTTRIYGISAQGGEYDSIETDAQKSAEAEELRQRHQASTRVDVVSGDQHSHDLTDPLAWLME
jgi:hypothetical protein